MAAHLRGRCRTSSSRFRQWECEERDWCDGDGAGLVWVLVVYYCDYWAVGDDHEYPLVGSVD